MIPVTVTLQHPIDMLLYSLCDPSLESLYTVSMSSLLWLSHCASAHWAPHEKVCPQYSDSMIQSPTCSSYHTRKVYLELLRNIYKL